MRIMVDDPMELLVDLHVMHDRQGPGSDDMTRDAIRRAGIAPRPDLNVVDLGCGTGASTLVLASKLNTRITAVDIFTPFLQQVRRRADAGGVQNLIQPVAASIDLLPFEDHSIDVIWSEGAVYNIGFARGVRLWQKLLRPGGILVVSELSWLSDTRPAELTAHWEAEYPEIATVAEKMRELHLAGYDVIDHMILDSTCWVDNYYRPIMNGLDAFVDRHHASTTAVDIATAERAEADLYGRFSDYFSYGMFIAQRRSES